MVDFIFRERGRKAWRIQYFDIIWYDRNRSSELYVKATKPMVLLQKYTVYESET